MKTLGIRTLSVLLFSTIFFACKKDNNPVITPVTPISRLNVVYASPSAEKLDVLIAGTKANSEDFGYTNKIGYLNVGAGSKKIEIAKKGQTTALVTGTYTLAKDESNSLFIIDKFADVKLLIVKDDLTAPASGKAKVRFVHLSPDAPALNVAIDGKTTDFITNKVFKDASAFEAIDPADKVSFNFKNKETGVVETTLKDVKIEANKIYTIYVRGLKANATGELALGASFFAH